MKNNDCKKIGIIFDMDGTLWDSSGSVAKSWTEALKQNGIAKEITKQDMMSVMGKTMDKLADIIFADFPKEERSKLLTICADYENEYLSNHGGILYPDLEKTFIELKKQFSLFIVSNCQKGYIETFLKFYNFEKYFTDIECYGNNLKSKGQNIKLIAQRNNLSDAYYVGDIQGDYDSTIEAGFKFIHAAYGFGKINTKVQELKQFSDLPELLKNIIQEV